MAEKKAQRVSVVLPGELADALVKLADERSTTITDVVRKAIATEAFLNQETKSSTLILQDKRDASKKREVIFRPT